MADLSRRGFRSARLDEWPDTDERSVLITFDDAYAGVAGVVTPILNEHGFTAVMFVPAAYIGKRNEWDAIEHPGLASLEIASASQIQSMAEGPWQVASHAWRHVDLRRLHSEDRVRELTQARESLADIAGHSVGAIAYPFGQSDESVRKDAKRAGYRLGFSAAPGPSQDPYRLPRHQINASDSLALFRLKTSKWLDRLRVVHGIAPRWARAGARHVVERAGAR